MEKLKCGLCGYEFDRGVVICRGCQGRVAYGSGGLKWLFGIVYFAICGYALKFIARNVTDVSNSVGWTIMGAAFLFGVIHCTYLFRKRVQITKRG